MKHTTSFKFTDAELYKIVEYQARKGGQDAVEDKSKTLIFLNGYGVSNRFSLLWALILAKNGYQVVSPDLRGMGKSEGKGPTFGKHEVEDLTQLLTNLQQSGLVKGESVGVIGISYGAGMASLWSAKDQRVAATILIAPYAQADETIINVAESFKKNLKFPFPITPESVSKGTRIAGQKLGVTWESISPAKAIRSIRHPILFITSSGDEIIPPAVVKKLYETAPKGSSFKSYNGIPHELVGYNVNDAGPLILDWLEKKFP